MEQNILTDLALTSPFQAHSYNKPTYLIVPSSQGLHHPVSPVFLTHTFLTLSPPTLPEFLTSTLDSQHFHVPQCHSPGVTTNLELGPHELADWLGGCYTCGRDNRHPCHSLGRISNKVFLLDLAVDLHKMCRNVLSERWLSCVKGS